MRIHIDSSTRGDERRMLITLRGDDMDFINLIDSASKTDGPAGNLIARVAEASGLVDVRVDDRAQVARLMRHAAEIMER